jgi:hypothetical protein
MKIPPFLLELVARLFSQNPTFFRVIQILSAITVIITGLPDFLSSIGVSLPENLLILENKTIAIASIVAMIIAQLPKKDK